MNMYTNMAKMTDFRTIQIAYMQLTEYGKCYGILYILG